MESAIWISVFSINRQIVNPILGLKVTTILGIQENSYLNVFLKDFTKNFPGSFHGCEGSNVIGGNFPGI